MTGCVDIRDIFGCVPLAEHEHCCIDNKLQLSICIVRDLFKEFPIHSNYKIYTTRAHEGVYDILLSQAKNLSNGNYINRQGESSSTLVGAKGIGKTTSLKTFTHICRYVVPGVHVLYVSFNNIMVNELLQTKSLTSIIFIKLRELGVQIPEPDLNCISLNEYLVQFFMDNNIKLLLLIDELDQLYKSTDKICLKTLHDLAYIGNQASGTLSTIVCGSSSLMELLITTNGGERVRSEFPLLNHGAPNLNGTKFLTKRISSNLPTDLSAVAIQSDMELDNNTVYWIRLVTFCAGVSARAVGRLLRDISNSSGQILVSLSPDTALNVSNTLSNSDIDALRGKILCKLFKRNAKMFDRIVNSSDIVAAIATNEWEQHFQPLKYADVMKSWKKLISKGKVRKESSGNLDDYLLHLGDRGWLTIGAIENCHPQDIYPSSMFHCFKEQTKKSDSMPEELRERIVNGIKQGASEFARCVSTTPRVVAAGGTASLLSTSGGCIVM